MCTSAEDATLRHRFTKALEQRGGTLVLSWVNVAEFAQVAVEKTARMAEEFVDENLPRLYLMEVNPFVVIERGDQPRSHADFALLGAFAGRRQGLAKPFSAQDLFTVMSGQGLERFKRWSGIYVKQVEGLREAYRDEEFRDVVDRALKEDRKDRALSVIIKEMMRVWMRDRQRKPKENDAQDFFHAVVPVHYCGAVFLDGDWEERVRQVRVRIEAARLPLTLAKVFSKKADGIERFLTMLEAA